jgi:hypothetical protein
MPWTGRTSPRHRPALLRAVTARDDSASKQGSAAAHPVLSTIRATTHVDGKPFSYPELRARVDALLRRADVRRRPGRLRVGELEVDAAARVVRLRGAPVELSQKESALVRTLASDQTRVFTKDELLRTIWGFRTLGSNRRKARYGRLVLCRMLAVDTTCRLSVGRRTAERALRPDRRPQG